MENMIALDYPFTAHPSLRNPWLASAVEDVPIGASEAYPQSNWDEFMRWNPSQIQSPKSLNAQLPLASPRPAINPLYHRRQDSSLHNSSQSLQSTDAPGHPLPASSSIPFTFGQATANPPAFSFPDSMPSPPVIDDQQPILPDASTWTSKLPMDANGTLLVSPVPPLSTPSLQHSPDTNPAHTSSSASESPEPISMSNPKKRKSSASEVASDQGEHKQPVKKTAHNMIEKRYRTNLNDKIAALRDSVPSLRIMSRSTGGPEDEDEPEDLEGLTPAHKLNKATILSKATEYIRHLEKRNRRLQDEVTSLKHRVQAYDKMAMTGGAFAFSPTLSTPDESCFPNDPFERPSAAAPHSHRSQGMIPVPQDIASLRNAAMNQPHYAETHQPYGMFASAPTQQPGATGPPIINRQGGGLANKIMIGALTGLMIMEGVREQERSGAEPDGRGLFSLQFSFFGRSTAPSGAVLGGEQILPILRVFVLLAAVAYLVLPLFDFKPQAKKNGVDAVNLSPAPSLASPVKFRRQAWLTAIQTVWVPQHSFPLEAAALILKTIKLSTRKLIGWQGYSLLTGTTQEQETARVKAWEIALDAQLTGGDEEISTSRLLLTLLASGTLPNTPSRMMLKALHIRLMLWDMSRAGYRQLWFWLLDGISKKMARSNWAAARKENLMIANGHVQNSETTEPLPDHLRALLEQHPETVLVDAIIQRAYNLAWNQPTSQNAETDASMDSVVEDFAISSPLDALASWYSSFVLGRALVSSLDPNVDTKAIDDDLILAVRTAPVGSRSHLRALVAKAVLTTSKRDDAIAEAYDALPATSTWTKVTQTTYPGTLLNVIRQDPVPNDVQAALTMAKCIALASTAASNPHSAQARDRAISAINGSNPGDSFTLVSFVAAYKCLSVFTSNPEFLARARAGLERIANALRVWAGQSKCAATGLDGATREMVVTKCLTTSRAIVGLRDADVDSDDGYVSADDDDLLSTQGKKLSNATESNGVRITGTSTTQQ